MTDKSPFLVSAEACSSDPDPEPCYPGPASASSSSPRPPPFSSLYFPPELENSKALVTEPIPSPVPAIAPSTPLVPRPAPSVLEEQVKAALPADTKGESSVKNLDDGEPPPPYTEGSSPLDGFTYVMAAAGGAASIITQVQQGGPAPVNTLSGTLGGRIGTRVLILKFCYRCQCG